MTASAPAGATSLLTQTFSKRKENAVMLAQSYTTGKRLGEIVSVALYCVLLAATLYNIYPHLRIENSWVLVVSCILAMTLADLFSGLAHWAADTWGSLETPLVGKTFIRSFREHHLDPFRITVHDVIETNGDNCMLTVPFLFLLAFKAEIKQENAGDLFKVCFVAFLCIWVSLTNQIHKWAHMIKPPRSIALLQDWYIILPRKNHQIHHHTPFDRYYCITTGWLNPLLGSIGFWKRMENSITWATGEIPRKDDAYWTVQNNNNNGTQQQNDNTTPNAKH